MLKVSCIQENLVKALNTVSRAVPTRTTLPITSNILLATDEGRLRLTATNLEITITTWIGAKIDGEGEITVPAKVFTDFVSSLRQDRVDLALDGTQLLVTCLRQKAKLATQTADDFPPIPKVQDGTAVTISGKELKKAVQRVAFSAATDESRPVLTGIYTVIDGDEMTLVAADGYRLSVDKVKLVTTASEKLSAIIPGWSYREIDRLVSDSDNVTILFNTNKTQVLFRTQNTEVVSQIIQGTYPNYNQLIPASADSVIELDGDDFTRASKTASIFSKGGSGIVRINVDNGQARVSSKSEELGDNTSEIDAKIEGAPNKIAFSGAYLLDIMSVLGKGGITLKMTNPLSPCVFKANDVDTYTHVLMPMFVQWE